MAEQRKIVTSAPENSETPLEALRNWGTPTRLFFVRNHFNPPTLDVKDWRLHVEGCVEKPLALSLDNLTKLPERTVLATVERADSAGGQEQPLEHDPLREGYLIHFCRPVTVRVEAAVAHTDYESILYDLNAYAEANSRRPLDVDLEFMAGEGI
jgi:hypothetical protein